MLNERAAGIIYLEFFGQPVMVINDANDYANVAIAMLDKKSAIYSGRPELVVATIAGYSKSTLLEQYAKEKDDYFVHLTDVVLSNFAEAVTPGRFLVDTFPILRYVPEWMPGVAWKRMVLTEWQKTMQENLDLPHEYVKQQMQSGTAVACFTSAYLEKGNLSEDEEDILKWTAQSMMGGGADTTVCASYVFFLAMVLHPEAQKKAQQELDTVIGPDRLPTLKDRSQLHYVDAVVKEVLRWHPVVPLGLLHRLMEDDIQDGYLIPKGSLIIPNVWKFLHDEETYKNPSEFRPERFLASEKNNNQRRIHETLLSVLVAGLLLADSSLFLTCAMVLSVFNISKAVENGVPVTPKEEFINGAINHPKVFKCSVKPRSEQAVSIIRSVDFVGE
ncbi:hypothetical protein EWM64_g1187 [Hericium alpestre]|uniref:Cytochrome P450 n=1 Tax=Hericium alpestre TaxID=135208 RepID=A0A4Z0AB75_9AGAM|nr:hypothetical protein EWM64_g1187 [Hericium alpestre]